MFAVGGCLVLPIGTQTNSYVLELLVDHIVRSHSHAEMRRGVGWLRGTATSFDTI